MCASESKDTSYDLLDCILRKVRDSQCCAEGLAKAGKKRIREVVGRDVAGNLPIQFLKAEDKLSDGFVGCLLDGIELAEEFADWDFPMEELQKSGADVLESGELPGVVVGLPPGRKAVEREYKLGDF